MNVIEKLFGTHSEREFKMIRPIVTKIESLRPEMIAKSDEELRDQTRILKAKLADGATLCSIRDVSQRCVQVKVKPWYLPVRLT